MIKKKLDNIYEECTCYDCAVIATDYKGKILYVNHYAEEIWEDDLKSKVVGKNFDSAFQILNTTAQRPVKRLIRYVTRNNVTMRFDQGIVIYKFDKKRISSNIICAPLRDHNGMIKGATITLCLNEGIDHNTIVGSNNLTSKNLIHLLDQLPSSIWVTDTNLEVRYVNKACLKATGSTMGDLVGKEWAKIIHPHDIERIKELMGSTDKTGRFQIEARYQKYDGTYSWGIISGAPFYNQYGQYNGFIGIVNQIDYRKETEEKLRRYELLSKHARDIMLFIDLEGNIIEANEAAVSAYGYTYEELCTINICDIRGEWAYTKMQMEQANQKGIFFEAVHRRKDGSTFMVEVSSQGADIGDKRILLSVIRDITDRKKAEKIIFESQAKYRSLFMNMNSGYAYFRLLYNEQGLPNDLRFVEVNDIYENFFGLSRDEIIGKNYGDMFPNSKDIIMDLIISAEDKLMAGKSVTLDEVYLKKFNKWFSIILYSPKENTIVLILIDISNMKQSQAKLIEAKETAEEANRAKSEFLANMSHEIRTPINGIVGMINLALLSDLNQDQKDKLKTAKACANNLMQIINDILDFSKMEAGKIVIEKQNFDLFDLLGEIIKSHAHTIEEKGILFKYHISKAIPRYLIGDPHRISQVLNNLISNAIKFTEKGIIRIDVDKVNNINEEIEIRFTVEDTGVGIALHDMKHLFKSFSQVEASYTKKNRGTGLGLAISKKLVELMEGTIGVDSEIGKGSKFFFNLTFVKGKPIKEIISVPSVDRKETPISVLVVEDDVTNQKVVLEMLKIRGYDIDTSKSGYDALALLEKKRYDVILMDIQMPDMDGIETTLRIREMEEGIGHTPIIALTAYALQGDKEKFMGLGMDGYVSKPIQIDELFKTIDTLTSNRERVNNEILRENSNCYTLLHEQPKTTHKEVSILNELEINLKLLDTAIEFYDVNMIKNMAQEIMDLANIINAVELCNISNSIWKEANNGNIDNTIKMINKLKKSYQHYLDNDIATN